MISGIDKNYLLGPLFDFIENRRDRFWVHGLKGSSAAYVLSQVACRLHSPLFVLTATEEKAERFSQEIRFFVNPDQKVFLYPSWDVKPFEKISPAAEVMGQRWQVRHHLLAAPAPGIVVASLESVV